MSLPSLQQSEPAAEPEPSPGVSRLPRVVLVTVSELEVRWVCDWLVANASERAAKPVLNEQAERLLSKVILAWVKQ